MRINEINRIKRDGYVVLLPMVDYDIRESVEYSFQNVMFLDYSISDKDIDLFIKNINDKNIQLILFDYDEIYRLILPYIHKTIKIKWVIKNGFASLTDGAVRATFANLMEFYDRDLIDCIGCLDYGAYKVLENAGHRAKHIMLDIKEKSASSSKKSNTIGLIGNDYDPNHNTYNQLTAITMVDYDSVKLMKHMPATDHFIKFFNIKAEYVESVDDAISNNFINLYCNFTNNNVELILKSMDLGIPCLLGNTDLFNKYQTLQKFLVLKSDDDVNEIANRIERIRDNKDSILKEYTTFRKNYRNASEKSVKEFLG